MFFFGSFTKKIFGEWILWKLCPTHSSNTKNASKKKEKWVMFFFASFFLTLLWEWIARLDCTTSLFLIISFFIVSFCVFVWVFFMCIYIGMMIHDFPGLLFWMIFLDWVFWMILLDWFFWMMMMMIGTIWPKHLTQLQGREGRKTFPDTLTFCVLLMLLESELHFIVLHLDFAFVPLSITLPDL